MGDVLGFNGVIRVGSTSEGDPHFSKGRRKVGEDGCWWGREAWHMVLLLTPVES